MKATQRLAPELVLAFALVLAACDGELVENVPEGAWRDDAGATAPATTSTTVSVHFEQIQQDIDSVGCSATGCHGSKAGGFGLTAAATGAALSANFEAFKQRATNGDKALILMKATNETPHGGGTKLTKTDAVYARWSTWIREGSPR